MIVGTTPTLNIQTHRRQNTQDIIPLRIRLHGYTGERRDNRTMLGKDYSGLILLVEGRLLGGNGLDERHAGKIKSVDDGNKYSLKNILCLQYVC